MAKALFANAASSLLAASIDDNDLTIQVDSGYGALYPNPSGGDYFIVTLRNAAGDVEFCKITSRTTDLLTVAPGGRGFDGSSAQSWTNGQTRVELRMTKAYEEVFIQRGGDAMDGDLDMNGNDVVDAVLSGDWKGVNGQLVGTAVRGVEDDSSNELLVPDDGSPATMGGSVILTVNDAENVRTAAFEVGMIMDWYGAAINCPEGWAICDGTNGTPDMRGLFSRGVDGSFAVGDTGGAAASSAGTTGSSGGHTHTTSTPGHTLTETEIPAHVHSMSNVLTYPNPGLRFGSNNDFQANTSGSTTGSTGGGAAHTHPDSTTSSDGAHTHTTPAVATVPPFRALYKIMFIGF